MLAVQVRRSKRKAGSHAGEPAAKERRAAGLKPCFAGDRIEGWGCRADAGEEYSGVHGALAAGFSAGKHGSTVERVPNQDHHAYRSQPRQILAEDSACRANQRVLVHEKHTQSTPSVPASPTIHARARPTRRSLVSDPPILPPAENPKTLPPHLSNPPNRPAHTAA